MRAPCLAALLIGSLVACTPAAPEPLLQSQPGWTVTRDAPVIEAGDLRAQGLWNDPNVIRTPDGYVMYLTTSTGEPFKPPVLPFRAVSRDGRSWRLSPEGALLSPAGGPYVSIETPSVVRFDGRWHMFFTGIYPNADPTPMAIGHAVSSDGIAWQVAQWTLLKATGKADDWTSYLVGEPGAVVVGDRLFVYFSAVAARPGGGPPLQTLGVITSSDGMRFSAPVQVLTQGPAYPVAQGFAGYSSPAAVVIGERVHLFYSVVLVRKDADPEWQQVAIHHAVSPDGIRDFREDAAPALVRTDTRWTTGEILAPSPLVEDDRLTLWFAGHVRNADLGPLINRGVAGPEFGIGVATRPLTLPSAPPSPGDSASPRPAR